MDQNKQQPRLFYEVTYIHMPQVNTPQWYGAKDTEEEAEKWVAELEKANLDDGTNYEYFVSAYPMTPEMLKLYDVLKDLG